MIQQDDFYIRQWTVDDWQTLKSMRIEAVSQHSHVFLSNKEKALSESDSYWQDMLSNTYNGAVFGLYKGQIAIGLTGAFRYRESKADTIIFGMSYIRQDYRGLGLSDLLYRARLDWAKAQNGITRILVGHRADNEASKRANQRHGFKLISTEDMTFGNGETVGHCTYELRLT